MIQLAPIALFVYNRPWHTQQTIEALQRNELAAQSDLIVFSDAPKNDQAVVKVQEVRQYVKNITGFKSVSIIERDENFGLAKSIITGVTEVVNKFGKIIVLEDDLVTSPCFLKFMNEALNMYMDEPRVISVHGYIYPIDNLPETFFIKGADCWGWATWSNKWSIFEEDGQKLLDELKSRKLQNQADFNGSYAYTKMLKDQIKGKNSSWAIRWYMSAFLKGMLTLYPGKSYVQNIGHDSEGTHCTTETSVFKVELNNEFLIQVVEVKEDVVSRNKIELFFISLKQSFFYRIKSKIIKVLT